MKFEYSLLLEFSSYLQFIFSKSVWPYMVILISHAAGFTRQVKETIMQNRQGQIFNMVYRHTCSLSCHLISWIKISYVWQKFLKAVMFYILNLLVDVNAKFTSSQVLNFAFTTTQIQNLQHDKGMFGFTISMRMFSYHI